MKTIKLFAVIFFFALCSCNHIPKKVVFEKLNSEEISAANKSDTSFSTFYDNVRKYVDDISDIKKEQYNNVTYRRLFSYYKFLKDTSYWQPVFKTWNNEWEKKFGIYQQEADSTLNYWKKYLNDHSLKNYVNVELADIDKEYYEYIGGLQKVNLGFKLTPLQGPIEQIRFTYRYQPKINGDYYYSEKHNCISTSPFSFPTIRFWEVDYSDKEKFSGQNVETFLRDYNLDIEITSIRKDGINISIDDFAVPEKVSDCLENETKYPSLFELSKGELIKELINNDFVTEWDYRIKKEDEIKEKKDKLCFDFLKAL